MPSGATDIIAWQHSDGAVKDLVLVLPEIRGDDGASCEAINEQARQLSAAASSVAKRQDLAEAGAGVIGFVLSVVVTSLWVASYPLTRGIPPLMGQTSFMELGAHVVKYLDLSILWASSLMFFGSFALFSAGLILRVRSARSPGRLVRQLVVALDVVVASPSDLEIVARHYAAVETAFLVTQPQAHTQFAQTQRRAAAVAAADSMGELELELRNVSRVPANHREALARLVAIVLLDQWEVIGHIGEPGEPETVAARIAAAGHGAPWTTKIAGKLAAVAATIPLLQGAWSLLQMLAT